MLSSEEVKLAKTPSLEKKPSNVCEACERCVKNLERTCKVVKISRLL